MISSGRSVRTAALIIAILIGITISCPHFHIPLLPSSFNSSSPYASSRTATTGNSIKPSGASALTYTPPDLTGRDQDNYKWWTEARLRKLAACTATRTCHKNAHKIAIFAAFHCHIAMFEEYMGGEGIWCKAMWENLEMQGYTVLHAREDWAYIYHLHRQMPDLIKIVIGDKKGEKGTAHHYYKSEGRLDGIPSWKHFHFSYFPHMGESVVGDRWTLCAEPEWHRPHEEPRNYTFAGYSLEPPPGSMHVVPFARRPHRAYILSKRIQYFHKWAHPMWELDYFTRAQRDLVKIWPDFEFIGGFVDDRGDQEIAAQGKIALPEGVKNLGLLNAEQFDKEVSTARILIGLGWPTRSPSPYRALAMGVPFLNPYKLNGNNDPNDKGAWHDIQHSTLRFLDPPYVYHTEAFNYNQFLRNIKIAMDTPIKPFRFDWHSRQSFTERMRFLMEADWQGEAERILKDRLAGHETQGRGGGEHLGNFML